MRVDYYAYLQSPKWHEFRSFCLLTVFDRVEHKYKCDCCQKLWPRTEMEVHHKHYGTLGNENREDVLVLCQDCHAEKHGKLLTRNVPKSLNGTGDMNDLRNAVLDALDACEK